ncbi:hypothetical protein [Parabacteroides sp. FAFU027]|uniref:hypothetical protein n=1 Tax=Parabacteroides sp. FAFU027 TaxID=2922715 RepID=UPI001FAF6F83|nr:hypothetical protein [Parabacteroides sp. FAFU027]
MKRSTHRILLTFYTIIPIAIFVTIGYYGYAFYSLPEAERVKPYPDPNILYNLWNPSGIYGHGLGIVGTLLILIGLFSYMARKHLKVFARWGTLKYWLDFHIFSCTLGAIMVLFHTTFKFGGIISIGFWSMAAVWVSGVIGRFIYIAIPRTIEGRELSLVELEGMQDEVILELKNRYHLEFSELVNLHHSEVKAYLSEKGISQKDIRKVKRMVKSQHYLSNRIRRLNKLNKIFHYWHVIHLPFALIMLVIMVIHVAITLSLGYSWIF